MENHKYLNQYVLEHVPGVTADFNNMRKSKSQDAKRKYWSDAVYSLKTDIEPMKNENTFPENE